MSDVLFVLLTLVCFALAVGTGRLLDRAMARDAVADVSRAERR